VLAPAVFLLCVFRRPSFTDDGHSYLPRVLHGLFDFLGNVARQPGGFKVINLIRLDDDTHFTPGLDGIGLQNAFESGRHILQDADALDIGLQVLTPCARAYSTAQAA